MERDFNDVLNDIVFADNRYRQMGFTRGFSLGEEAGWREGYTLGLQKGAQLASELGFYQGFVHAWITVLEKDETTKQRKLVALRSLLEMTKSFPKTNVPDQDFVERIQKIRAKFKQVLSLLDINTSCDPEPEDERPEMSF
ncbi:protein LTO1 homolog isoform X1 [Tachypleus tridentatus]|uniref:protein LTO1 homolog isoform X1 n=1 Tax=Tachypleus tridentatus TaxID=6853 RepID=UPI003FCF4F45